MKTKPQVIVRIDGGCLTSVTTSEPMDVYFFDFDNIEGGDAKDYLEDPSYPCDVENIPEQLEIIFQEIREADANFRKS